MRSLSTIPFAAALAILFAACSQDATSPTGPQSAMPESDLGDHHGRQQFNLNVLLRGDGRGFIEFRQPNDGAQIVNLDIRVLHLAPNSSYLLQRAVDPIVDDDCTSTAWLTLGKGLTPQAISTDEHGRGREQLFRDLSAVPAGTPFDIHFQVIDAATSAVVLTSGCYQFTVNAN